MPSDGSAGAIFVDEGHRERARFYTGPRCGTRDQRTQKVGYRPCRRVASVVGRAEERHSPLGHHTTHLEVRELDSGNMGRELGLFNGTDEVFAIAKTVRGVRGEE